MVAVVTTSVISIAGVQTVLVAGYRDQEVGGNATTPAKRNLMVMNISVKYYIIILPSWP